MARWLSIGGFLLLFAGVVMAEEPPPPAPDDQLEDQLELVTLRTAALEGRVRAEGFQPSSYRRVHLSLKNVSREALDIDVCASHLEPKKRGSCQRLGLGPPVESERVKKKRGSGRIIVTLDPGEKTIIELNTCCLDAGRPAPGDHVFEVAKKPLPEVRETVLRWWADNPTAPQSAVNAAIWQFRDTVTVKPGVVEHYREPKGRFAAAHGGTYYRVHDGELMSLDAEGIVRLLGTEIFQVIPVEGAVYAVALGEDRRPDLWRLTLTGREPWGFVMNLGVNDRVLDLIPAADGNLVLVTDKGIRYWNREGRTLSRSLSTELFLHLSTRLAARDRLTATVQRPPKEPTYRAGGERFGEQAPVFELWTIDLKTGEAVRAREFWNVRAMLAGPAGVFGISHRGRLRKRVGTSFRDLGPDEKWERILAVGNDVLWLVGEDDRLALASPRTGRVRTVLDLKVGDVGAVHRDDRTDDLAFVMGAKWYRARAETGQVEEVRIGE